MIWGRVSPHGLRKPNSCLAAILPMCAMIFLLPFEHHFVESTSPVIMPLLSFISSLLNNQIRRPLKITQNNIGRIFVI